MDRLMHIDPSQVASPIIEKINDLLARRTSHLRAVDEIDSQLKKACHALDIDPAQLVPNAAANRLPSAGDRSIANRYPLNPNTIGAHMLEILLKADKGYAKLELRKEIEKEPRYALQIKKNVNAYYNLINRYLKNGRIVEDGGLLYHADRAPLPAGAEDPSGQHLPANVSPLFAERKLDIG